jgi:hypothetical protein
MSKENAEALKRLAENPKLLDDLDKVSPGLKDQVYGYTLSKWLPDGIVRNGLMLLFAVLGLLGLFSDFHRFLVFFILVPLFSPRVMGEVSALVGRISKL